MVSALGKNIPVFESPVGVIEGAEVLPTATVVTPLFVMLVPDTEPTIVTLPVAVPIATLVLVDGNIWSTRRLLAIV
jgi:hypothetical protein